MTEIPPIPGKTVTRPKHHKWYAQMELGENAPEATVKTSFNSLRKGVSGMMDDVEAAVSGTPTGIKRLVLVRIDYMLGDPRENNESVSWLPTKEES